jgi:hypothetical protein
VTRWTRVAVATLCGGCGQALPAGHPVFTIELAGVKGARRFKVRCESCAGPAPPSLPAVVQERVWPPPLAFVRFAAAGLPLDFKMRQAEREPGEEG